MEHYIGVDFHMQHSSVAVLDKAGNLIDERKLYHADIKGCRDYFASFPKGTSVSVEATRNWYWLIDSLQELGLDPKLVHAKKVRIIAESTIKTDTIDARTLAHLDRCNFLPCAYIADKQTRSTRELLRYHMSLVKIRSSVKNRIHALLAKNNIQHNFTDLFGKAGTEFLDKAPLTSIFRIELDGYMLLLKKLKELTDTVQKEIKASCAASRYAQLLMTIPGVGYFTGLLLAAEIADIKRFSTYKKLCAYAGLTSSTHQSADKTYHGHIIKDSNKYIRYGLVEAVPAAVKKDPRLWATYTVMVRKKGIPKAKIIIARKMLTAIYFMLRDNTPYIICNNKYNSQVNPLAKLGA